MPSWFLFFLRVGELHVKVRLANGEKRGGRQALGHIKQAALYFEKLNLAPLNIRKLVQNLNP